MKLPFFLLLATSVLLTACEPQADESSFNDALKLNSELADCKSYRLRNENSLRIIVVRCPNSTTSTTLLKKEAETAIVIDGGDDNAKQVNENKGE